MKMNSRNFLVSNPVTIVIIFALLSIFDHSGGPLRNIIIVFVGFIVMIIYDFVRTGRRK